MLKVSIKAPICVFVDVLDECTGPSGLRSSREKAVTLFWELVRPSQVPPPNFTSLYHKSPQGCARGVFEELLVSVDESYERILQEIQVPKTNRVHGHWPLQCLAVVVRPLWCAVFAIDFKDLEAR
jgi:hypothetical protein